MKKTIFQETYNGESMVDVNRDVWEAFDEKFNSEVKGIPTDKNGFFIGTFEVAIVWKDDSTPPATAERK